MRGHNFKSGNCMVTWDFITYYVETSFSSIDQKFSTFDTDLWKLTLSEKLQIRKSWEITNWLHHTCPWLTIDHWTAIPCSFKFAQVIHPYWSLHRTCPVNSARVIWLRYAWQCCSKIIPALYFSFTTFQSLGFNLRHFHKSVSNVVCGRKMRYQNVDGKFLKGLNIWNYDPSYKCGLLILIDRINSD